MAGSRTGSLLPSGSSRSDGRGSRANLCYTLLRPGEPQELVPDGAVALRGCSTHGAALPRGGMVTWEEERSLFSCPGCRGDPWVPVGPCIPVAAGQMCRAAAVLLGWKRQKQLHRAPCQDTPGTVLRVSASGATILSPCSCPAPPPPKLALALPLAPNRLYWKQGGQMLCSDCSASAPPSPAALSPFPWGLPCPRPPVPATGADHGPRDELGLRLRSQGPVGLGVHRGPQPRCCRASSALGRAGESSQPEPGPHHSPQPLLPHWGEGCSQESSYGAQTHTPPCAPVLFSPQTHTTYELYPLR